MESKKNELYIPLPVTDSRDYITGFGQREMGYLIVSFVVAIFIGILFQILFGNVATTVVSSFSFIGLMVIIVRKDNYDENLIDKVHIFIEYQKCQKRYEYEYYDWLETPDSVFLSEEDE